MLSQQGAIPYDDDEDDDGQQIAGNIPIKPAGSGGEGPNPNPFPVKDAGFGKRTSMIPTKPAGGGGEGPNPNPFPTKDGGFGKRADSGAIPEGAANDDQTASLDDALQTVDQIMQYGYQKSGLTQDNNDQQAAIPDPSGDGTMAMADGGPVDNASEQPALNTGPAEGGGEGQSLGQQAGSAIRTMAPPAPGGQQGVQQILRLIQGAGAMPTQQAQAIETQTGAADPNVAKALAIHTLAQNQGPDAAFSYLQSLRKQYDLFRTNAAVKANMGRLDLSTQSANQAMTNIVDGTDTKFVPGPDGKSVIMTVTKAGQRPKSAKRFDDGGPVPDANGNDDEVIPEAPQVPQGARGATPNTPEAQANDEAINNAVVGAGKAVGKFVLSIPQYYQMLMGKEGMYDHIWNTSPGVTAQQVAKGVGMQPPGGLQAVGAAVKRFGNPDLAQSPAANNVEGPTAPQTPPVGGPGGAAPVPPPVGRQSNVGLPQFSQQRPAAPQAPGQTAPAPQGGGVKVYSDDNPPPGNPPGKLVDHQKELVAAFGADAVRAAQLAHPNDNAAIMAQLTGEREKNLGYEAQQANTRIIAEGRGNVANIRAGTQLTVAQIRAAASNQNSANRLFGQLEGIAAGMHNNAVTNRVRALDTKVAGGGILSDNEAAFIQSLQARAAQMPQQQQPPAARQPVQAPSAVAPLPAKQQVVYINNKPYYTDGVKVLGPAQ